MLVGKTQAASLPFTGKVACELGRSYTRRSFFLENVRSKDLRGFFLTLQ